MGHAVDGSGNGGRLLAVARKRGNLRHWPKRSGPLLRRLDEERARMIAEAPTHLERDADGRTWLVRDPADAV
jgi:hypothetical protein